MSFEETRFTGFPRFCTGGAGVGTGSLLTQHTQPPGVPGNPPRGRPNNLFLYRPGRGVRRVWGRTLRKQSGFALSPLPALTNDGANTIFLFTRAGAPRSGSERATTLETTRRSERVFGIVCVVSRLHLGESRRRRFPDL